MSQLPPSRHIELTTAGKQAGQCKDHGQLVCGSTPCRREYEGGSHHTHSKQPCQQRLSFQQGVIATFYFLYRSILFDDEVKADGIHRGFHLFEGNHGIVIFHQCSTRGKVYTGRRYTLLFTKGLLYVCRARRTCHAHNGDCAFLNHAAKVR